LRLNLVGAVGTTMATTIGIPPASSYSGRADISVNPPAASSSASGSDAANGHSARLGALPGAFVVKANVPTSVLQPAGSSSPPNSFRFKLVAAQGAGEQGPERVLIPRWSPRPASPRSISRSPGSPRPVSPRALRVSGSASPHATPLRSGSEIRPILGRVPSRPSSPGPGLAVRQGTASPGVPVMLLRRTASLENLESAVAPKRVSFGAKPLVAQVPLAGSRMAFTPTPVQRSTSPGIGGSNPRPASVAAPVTVPIAPGTTGLYGIPLSVAATASAGLLPGLPGAPTQAGHTVAVPAGYAGISPPPRRRGIRRPLHEAPDELRSQSVTNLATEASCSNASPPSLIQQTMAAAPSHMLTSSGSGPSRSASNPLVRASSACPVTAPPSAQNGCRQDAGLFADSLTKQLEALQEAKSQRASQQAWSAQYFASRQDNTRWEAIGALRQNRLAEVLSKWPSPREAEFEANVAVAPRSCSSSARRLDVEQVSLDTEPPPMVPTPSDAGPMIGVGSSALTPLLADALARQSSKTALGTGDAAAGCAGGEADLKSLQQEAEVSRQMFERDESMVTLHNGDAGGCPSMADSSAWVEQPSLGEVHTQASGPSGYAGGHSVHHGPAVHQENTAPEIQVAEEQAQATSPLASTFRPTHTHSPPRPRGSIGQSGRQSSQSQIPHPPSKLRSAERSDEAKSQLRRPAAVTRPNNTSPRASLRGEKPSSGPSSPPSHPRTSVGKRPSRDTAIAEAAASAVNLSLTIAREVPIEVLLLQPHAEPSLEEVEAISQQCFNVMNWCANSFGTKEMRELRSFTRPPAAVGTVVTACAQLLGMHTEASTLRKVLTSALPEKLRGLRLEDVSFQSFSKAKRAIASADFDEDNMRTVCKAAVPLAAWGRAVGICLAKTRFWNAAELEAAAASSAASATPSRQRQSAQHNNQAPQEAPPPAPTAMPTNGLIIEPNLAKLSLRQLKEVKDLTVSRPEVGAVTFHGLTDCSSLDIERHVHLGVGEVLVYPEAGFKPPVGEGLNKRATVTMYQCWPPNGRSHLADSKAQERYRWKIQQMTEEKRAKFIDYDCLTGVWKFQVEHF